jgi:hypothetical protein
MEDAPRDANPQTPQTEPILQSAVGRLDAGSRRVSFLERIRLLFRPTPRQTQLRVGEFQSEITITCLVDRALLPERARSARRRRRLDPCRRRRRVPRPRPGSRGANPFGHHVAGRVPTRRQHPRGRLRQRRRCQFQRRCSGSQHDRRSLQSTRRRRRRRPRGPGRQQQSSKSRWELIAASLSALWVGVSPSSFDGSHGDQLVTPPVGLLNRRGAPSAFPRRAGRSPGRGSEFVLAITSSLGVLHANFGAWTITGGRHVR